MNGRPLSEEEVSRIQKQNRLMLSALERIANETVPSGYGGFNYRVDLIKSARDTIAQVKSLTVSKQEESTVSEVACEQTNKDSLNVARQNNPTHPTEQINRLAAEVESDMQWRGEPK